jgi:hypothetical protein
MAKKLSKDIKCKMRKRIGFSILKKSQRFNRILCLDTDFDDDALETFKRYKPRSLDELANRTKFSKKEIQLIYQGFKQECPSGMINLNFISKQSFSFFKYF